jgi:hypothetical protein
MSSKNSGRRAGTTFATASRNAGKVRAGIGMSTPSWSTCGSDMHPHSRTQDEPALTAAYRRYVTARLAGIDNPKLRTATVAASHAMTWERPAEVAKLVTEFVGWAVAQPAVAQPAVARRSARRARAAAGSSTGTAASRVRV